MKSIAPVVCAAALVASLTSSSNAHGDEGGLGIAVLSLRTDNGVDPGLAPTLTGLVSSKLQKTGVFHVVTEDDVKQMVSFDQMKTALSCDDQASCLGEIGQALGVPYVLTGTIGKLGSSLVVSFVLIDINKAKTLERESATYANEDAVVKGLDAEVERAVRQLLYREKGRVLVTVNEEGATIAIDGSAVGTSPLAEQEIASGPHRIVASKEGFIEDARDVVVKPREQTSTALALKPSPAFLADYKARTGGTRALAWSTTIGAAVLGVASIGLLVGPNVYVESQRTSQHVSGAAPLVVDPGTGTTIYALYWSGWGALALAAVSGGASTYFWATGDDPARYDAASAGATR